MLAEPNQGADRAGGKDEAVSEAPLPKRRQPTGQFDRHSHARQVVVGQGGVAHMARKQHLVARLARQNHFSIRERPRREFGVDTNFVLPFRERLELLVRQTKAPGRLVIGGTVRNPTWPIRQAMQMGPQFGQRHPGMHRDAVLHHVQVVVLKIDDSAAAGVFHVGVADGPLGGHDPVERRRARGNLVTCERDQTGQGIQRLPQAGAGDATANRIQFGDQGVHPRAPLVEVGRRCPPWLHG